MAIDKKVLNVPHLRFPEFTEEWERKRFKDVCNITTGNKNTQDKSDDGIYPFYVRSQIVERINSWTFDGEAILTAGDGVGVGKVFHYSTGKIGVHQRVYILSDFKCDGKYLYSYFAGNFYNRVKRMSAKNSVDSVRMEMIADMPISLPSNEEQKKIGHLLALLDERIATQNKIIEDLNKLKSAIIEMEYTHKTKGNTHIGDFIEQTSKRNKDSAIQNVLSVSNSQGFIQQCEQFENRSVASDGISNYKIVERNCFAFNPARINVGSIARLTTFNRGIVSPMYICFRTKDNLFPEYLDYYFESKQFFTEIQKRLEGSVRQCLSYEGLCNIPLCIPTVEVQQQTGKRLSTLVQEIKLEIDFLELLQKQKKFLLHQMFI